MTPAQIKVLELARDDGVLLIARQGTFGSIDSRKEVRRDVVRRMANAGYLKRDISHGSDNDDGYRITPAGLAALGATYKTQVKEK